MSEAHPTASILEDGRVALDIKVSDYRLIVVVRYENAVVMIRPRQIVGHSK